VGLLECTPASLWGRTLYIVEISTATAESGAHWAFKRLGRGAGRCRNGPLSKRLFRARTGWRCGEGPTLFWFLLFVLHVSYRMGSGRAQHVVWGLEFADCMAVR